MTTSTQCTTVPVIARATWDHLDAEHRRGDPESGTACVGRQTGRGLVFVACRVRDSFPLFEPGQTVMTTNASRRLEAAGVKPEACYRELLARHLGGDWGLLPIEDHESNDHTLGYHGRLLSAYDVFGERVWLITEADRSVTTLLLPEDY